MAEQWLDVNSTAEELGISTDAVRKRIARGSLESDRRGGHVLVWLDDGRTEDGHEVQGEVPADGEALVEVLTDQVSYSGAALRGEGGQEAGGHDHRAAHAHQHTALEPRPRTRRPGPIHASS